MRLGSHEDETYAVSDWSVPRLHYLESWGDARTSDGTLVPIQPLIAPLFEGMTELELLARLAGLEPNGAYEIVRETFRALGGGGEEEWKRFLFNGFLEGSAAKPVEVALAWAAVNGAVQTVRPASATDNLEVVFHAHYCVDDGRYNNNGWLQELPEPITKVAWENLILLSPKTFESLGLVNQTKGGGTTQASLVKVVLGGLEVVGPAWAQPGMADGTVGLALGYGRQLSGRVGRGAGYDAYQVRTMAAPHFATGATVTPLGQLHAVSTVQHHWAMEGRPAVREANLDQYYEHPDFAHGMKLEPPPTTQPLYQNPFDQAKAKGFHQWGMSIDLNSCVGCSACVLACQSENNIPIVGKDQVGRSREMHWLRIDRYYAGAPEDPQVALQALLCQHCEAAPCENVCPVNATSHDDEGLNVMTYNRCVGTRYCSNNCPYKVRRFNFFDYNKRPLDQLKGPFYSTPLTHSTDGKYDMVLWLKNQDYSLRPAEEWELLKLVKNPDVTVRMRGVMEKCTYCVQRIQQAEIAQKVKARDSGNIEVPEGTIKTACQQACPAEAIVFGNLKDPNSRVSRLKAQQRDYKLLDFLGTKPRTTYLARVRNPNPRMPDYRVLPASWEEYEKRNGNPLQQLEEEGKSSEVAPRGRGRVSERAGVHISDSGLGAAAGTGAHSAGGESAVARVDHRQGRRDSRGQDAGVVVVGVHPQRAVPAAAGGDVILPYFDGGRRLGLEPPGHVGLGDCEFRLVDRHRPRRHAHLGDSLPVAPALADFNQPCGRGHDHLRRDVRRDLPPDPHRAGVVRLVAVPAAQLEQHLAAVPLAADVGRVRRLDLLHRVGAFLVCGADSRPGNSARPGQDQGQAVRLWPAGAGLDRVQPPLEQLREGVSHPGWAGDAAGLVGAQHGVVGLLGVATPWMAHDDLPALFCRRGHLLGVWHGADPDRAIAKAAQAGGDRDDAAHRFDVQGDAGNRLDRRVCLCDGVLHRLVQRQPV